MARPVKKQPNTYPLVALVAAWLIPGAGHVYLGRITRGVVIFVTIAALFWSGVAVGGVLTIDAKTERWWFVANLFAGVHGVVSWYRFRVTMRTKTAEAAQTRTAEAARRGEEPLQLDEVLARDKIALVAPADTVARTYSGVAGLLNLMCIFDAVILSFLGVRGEAKPEEDKKLGQKEGGS